jgi:hypothetical protein
MSRVSRETRELVRSRAGFRCEYCRKPDAVGNYPPHVDHIIAVKHGGSSDLDNLAWACFQCNTAKSSDIASYDRETLAIVPLYNPRTQSWEDHFEMMGAVIAGRTPVGRATIQALLLNEPEPVEVRARLMSAGLWG